MDVGGYKKTRRLFCSTYTNSKIHPQCDVLDQSATPVLLGLPNCKDAMSRYVFVMGTARPWGMCVAKSTSEDLALYATIYVASHYLIEHELMEDECVQQPCLYDLKKLNDWVFLDEENEKVWKFFDTDSNFFHPNLELLEGLFDSDEITLDDIGPDLQLLKSKYIHGDHNPQSLSQFYGIFEMLHNIHQLGYVHGDIRLENMIFFGDTSFLIDFDLSKREHS